jgi:hypothetical protein
VTKHRCLSTLPIGVRKALEDGLVLGCDTKEAPTFISQADPKPGVESSTEFGSKPIPTVKSISERVVVNDNRPLAIRILDIIERYHSENACLRIVLRENFVSRWPHKLRKLMNDPQIAAEITDELRPIRGEVMRSADPAEQLDALSRCFQELGRRKD